MKTRVAKITRSQYSIQTIDVLFSSPVINSSDFSIKSGIPDRTAQRIIQKLENDEILRRIREGRGLRSPKYLFLDLLDITENDDR
jgi:Fic family protein